MWRILITVLLLAGCAQLPPTPADLQARRFESAPDKSAIYVVRLPLDSAEAQSLMLDGRSMITTLPGTYFRWDVAPGTHRVAGFAGGSESVTLTTAPGRIYFLQHTVIGDRQDGGVQTTALRQIGDQAGRELVMRSELLK